MSRLSCPGSWASTTSGAEEAAAGFQQLSLNEADAQLPNNDMGGQDDFSANDAGAAADDNDHDDQGMQHMCGMLCWEWSWTRLLLKPLEKRG